MPYPFIDWLNDDILLGIFNCYRLDPENLWNGRPGQNIRPGWCKLFHVCRRWRHLIYEFAFHLGMHIECTNGSPILDTLDHLPPLPLIVIYGPTIRGNIAEQDELGIHRVLGLRDRLRHIDLNLPPSILHKVLVLMDGHFPILEHLSLSFAAKNNIPLTLPKTFLAPNVRYVALPGFSPPRRLRVFTSTASLVRLKLRNIQTSSYFRPRVLAARLSSLPQLEELSIEFSIPIPRPSTERELLGVPGAPVTLPSLKSLQFKGVGAYLESLVAQIRVPLLERLWITLFNQIAFALPHLSYLINITEALKLPRAAVGFERNSVYVNMDHHGSEWFGRGPFHFIVICKELDWQIDCAAQICHALIPTLSGVEDFTLRCYHEEIPTEFQNGAMDGATWHELLRPFIELKQLHIRRELVEELSRALQVDEVGSDPSFLPNLRSIHAGHNLFKPFIYTRRVVGRPIQFVEWDPY
jgi:hypothetical protein